MRSFQLLATSLALALAGCASQAPWTTTSVPEAEKPPKIATRAASASRIAAVETQPATGEARDGYKLDAGDRVRVVVAGEDALSNSYDVSSGGTIDIPTLGKVTARGLDTVQLSAAIAKRLKQKQKDAHVAVQIETYRPFTIRGGVANPGQYPYVNNMTAETAIAIAGGLKPGADKAAVIVSGNGQRGPASLDSPVRPGDTVIVPEAN